MQSRFTRYGAKMQIYPSISPAAARSAAAVNGTAIDKRSAEVDGGGPWLEGELIVETGAVSGTPTSFSYTVKLQESANNSDWTDVTDERVEASTVVVTTADTIARLGFRVTGLKRYIRPVATLAFVEGTTPKLLCNVSVALGYPQRV